MLLRQPRYYSCPLASFPHSLKTPKMRRLHASLQTTPVQPERPPQQSEQAREQDQKRSEDVRVGRDWRAQQRNDPGDRATGRGHYDRDDRTVDRNLRMERDDRRGDGGWDRHHYYRDSGSDFDDDRGRRRVKTCVEYENGDEYCRYRYTRDR